MKLKSLLLLTFLPFVTLCMLAGMFYLNWYAGLQYRWQIEEKLLVLSQVTKERVVSSMNLVRDNSRLMAGSVQLRSNLRTWNRRGRLTDRLAVNRTLIESLAAQTILHSLSVYDAAGRSVSRAGAGGTDSLNQDWRQLEGAARIIREDGKALILYALPLEMEGEKLGYLVAKYHAEFLQVLLRSRTGLGETGEWLFAVRDDKGDAMYVVPLRYDAEAAFQRRVSKHREDVPIVQALSGKEIVMSQALDYRDRPVLAVTRYIREYDWGLVVKMDESEVHGLVNAMHEIIYFHALAVISLSIVFGIFLTRLIARPVESLQAHAAKIVTGVFTPYKLGWGWAEAKQLAENINQMVASMVDLSDNLQNKVDERTRELATAKRQLEELVVRDPLTGIHNRRYLTQQLGNEFAKACRYGTGLTLVIFDVDRFKTINDSWGHAVGDKVLTRICAHIKLGLRESDVFARIGGEEFCLLLPSEVDVGSFVNRLRREIAGIQFKAGSSTFRVTCSFGCVQLDSSIETAEDMMKFADDAMYAAKRNGRNCVVDYSSLKLPSKATAIKA